MSQHDESHPDHRHLAQRLDLLHFQDEAPGMVFWHPRGFLMYRLLEEAARAQARAQGYAEVRTPQILRRPVWEASGHWQHFVGGMFRVDDESCEAAVKPVSCPGHVYITKRRVPSYRDLPLRLCEIGLVHRDEPGGTLHGLLRLRQFTQDDGHIFCAEADAEAEVLRFCAAVPAFYAAFGFADVELAFSTRPEARAGDDASWDHAEGALRAVLEKLGRPYRLQPGAGAFYGPKVEVILRDRGGREWQCGTIQFDLVMPKRFDLRYVDASGERRHPVMLHRALYGSLERFLGILLEHHGAALPPWLCPVQAVVCPIARAQADAADSLARRLRERGLRVEVAADDSLARRVAEAHALAVPFVVVVGAREVAAGAASIRAGDERLSLPIEAATDLLVQRCAAPREGLIVGGR